MIKPLVLQYCIFYLFFCIYLFFLSWFSCYVYFVYLYFYFYFFCYAAIWTFFICIKNFLTVVNLCFVCSSNNNKKKTLYTKIPFI